MHCSCEQLECTCIPRPLFASIFFIAHVMLLGYNELMTTIPDAIWSHQATMSSLIVT